MVEKIWVVVQLREGALHPMSKEAIAGAQHLAGLTGGAVEVVVPGSGLETVGAELAGLDVEKVVLLDHPGLAAYTPGAHVGALAPLLREVGPDLVLFPHSYQSIDYVPRLAQEVDAALVSEVVSVRKEDDQLLWRRPVFAGRLQSDVRVRTKKTTFATLQSGAFSADDLKTGTAPVEVVTPPSAAADRELLGVEEVAGEHVDLSQAKVIVAVGRGIGDAEKMSIVEELAQALGAEIGASRPVIDSGWLDRDRQIGSSGQTVAPKLYVAVGISGAIQHLVGMKGSQVVVAVNKDASAPIFGVADYGIVGDLFEVVPAITAAVKAAQAG